MIGGILGIGLVISYLATAWSGPGEGDTLFNGSIGRTDLWGGDSTKIIKSIENRLFTLEEETLVIPGHGEFTKIYREKRTNPFFV